MPATGLPIIARPRLDTATGRNQTEHSAPFRRGAAQRVPSLRALPRVETQDGDSLVLTSDKCPGNILVRVEDSILGERTQLPSGSKLGDPVTRLQPAPLADMTGLRLFRHSVAGRQRDLLEGLQRSEETHALTARSVNGEEALLRKREREHRAYPRGRRTLMRTKGADETPPEDTDKRRVSGTCNVVCASGEMLMPDTVVLLQGSEIVSYLRRAGGDTQSTDQARVLMARQDGSVVEARPSARVMPTVGDELLVMPKVKAKKIEVTRWATQITCHAAMTARIALGL